MWIHTCSQFSIHKILPWKWRWWRTTSLGWLYFCHLTFTCEIYSQSFLGNIFISQDNVETNQCPPKRININWHNNTIQTLKVELTAVETNSCEQTEVWNNNIGHETETGNRSMEDNKAQTNERYWKSIAMPSESEQVAPVVWHKMMKENKPQRKQNGIMTP